MHTYPMTVAGVKRELPICKVTDDLYIGAFICFGDAELTVACARELLKLVPAESYDYLFTAEAKSIPLIPPVRGIQVFCGAEGPQGLHAGSHSRGGPLHYHGRRSGAVPGPG